VKFEPNNHPLAIAASAAVALRIRELERDGGPTEGERERVRAFGRELGSRADVLMMGGGKPGEVEELFAKLVDGLAVLAFCPGGVKFAGEHFAAGPMNGAAQ
jgi:hypothetical protein